MKRVLLNYARIQNRFSTVNTKEERKKRHRLLEEWEKEPCSLPDSTELISFMKEYDQIPYVHQFLKKIVYPCLKEELSSGKSDLFAFLLSHGIADFSYECLIYLCDKEQIGLLSLAETLTNREPDNIDFTEFYCKQLGFALSFSVHELPMGLLDSEDELSSFKLIDAWENTAKKLGMNVKREADEYRDVFRAWYRYLEMHACGSFNGNFEAYLIQNNIPWKHFFTR